MELRRTIAMKGSWIVFTLLLFALPSQATVQMYYLHNDHLGTPRVVTNQAQQVVWKGQLKPFGETKVEIEAITNHRRLPGQRFDIESRLYYNYFRDYDPSTGRYIQSDPIGLRGGLNTHGYVGGNPVNRVDPTGQCYPITIGIIIWGVAYANHAGDYISLPNGSLNEPIPGAKQDMECSLPEPVGTIFDATVLGQCIEHDSCYASYGCTATSWIPSLLGGTKSCNRCNSNFFK
jgi:RHS repeat-associated protein